MVLLTKGLKGKQQKKETHKILLMLDLCCFPLNNHRRHH